MPHRLRWLQHLCQSVLLFLLGLACCMSTFPTSHAFQPGSLERAFHQAAEETGVPVELLQAICYMEGRLSNHGGTPSIDHGYGCMHLVQNGRANTLRRAADVLHTSEQRLRTDIATNIRGGAYILREEALRLSRTHTLPASLGEWAGVVARYSDATMQETGRMYVEAVYKLLNTGFRARAESGEEVTVTPRPVYPRFTGTPLLRAYTALPRICRRGGAVDYPGAINCIVDPATYDCKRVVGNKPCNYEGARRPADYAISHLVIHDIEGTALSALKIFHRPDYGGSAHYIVDSDGTIYQVIREQDVAYHAGNLWYNRHTIGIEHAGYDATGYLWYNAAEYLASARLAAHLIKKYGIPLDHDHIISHGMIPSPALSVGPNHVDPGPYWLWPYYLRLISAQAQFTRLKSALSHVVTIVPRAGSLLLGKNGRETVANFAFFYLYNGPGTASGLIPAVGEGAGVTNIANNVEAEMSYYYTERKIDARTGMRMYRIWFGVQDPTASPPRFAHARQVWLAVPGGDTLEGRAAPMNQVVKLKSSDGEDEEDEENNDTEVAQVYGKPEQSDQYVIGDAPAGAAFVATATVRAQGELWYQINYNHRQAWVPEQSITTVD